MWRIATKSHEMQSPKSLLQRSGASISIDGCVKLEKLMDFIGNSIFCRKIIFLYGKSPFCRTKAFRWGVWFGKGYCSRTN